MKWSDGDYFDWQNHVRELNAKNDKSAVEALLKGKTLSFLTLRDVCNAYANKPLKVIGSNYNFTFESEGVTVNSLADLSEWKNAVSVCTRTLRLEDYMRRAYLDSKLIEGKEIITNSSDISDGSLSLREEDEKSSLAYGKEYLKDRLSGLSDDKVKEQIFKWCKYLGNKAASSGTWNNDKVNFATYCMKGKDSPSRRNRRNAVELVKSKQPKVQTLGEYLQKEYLDHNYLGNKRFVSSAGEVSDSVYALRQDDEKNYESLSMRDKEFLQDRLKEKSLDLVKNEVFEWCNFLKSRSVVTKDRNLHNLRTYCLTEK
ncbi:hypothetical protein HF1_12750 [Mycoplasma haemofelis str. Langford 1]|uniref:Uncharacterized protein n=1 Tax=Mycoplasma haemofelis (strain Langford 1) TaxID=941640 RepID=E8ZJG2_MYCHL|nr:hypothetical protein [Mycoplasma haemofelis]CBY93283.1 hypothetical protein HF1_12750 [Mycoplasma haemofelis str. Langford 1]